MIDEDFNGVYIHRGRSQELTKFIEGTRAVLTVKVQCLHRISIFERNK